MTERQVCLICRRPTKPVKHPLSSTPMCAPCDSGFYRIRIMPTSMLDRLADAIVRRSRMIFAAKHGLERLRDRDRD